MSQPMTLATQGTAGPGGESSSLSYEETQVETDILTDHHLGLQKVTEGNEEEEEEEKPKLWARLVSLTALVPHQDLFVDPPGRDEEDNDEKKRSINNNQTGTNKKKEGDKKEEDPRVGLYTLGRGKKCHFIFKQKSISNEHCRLYCLVEGEKQRLCPYVEDNSANGTFVNKSTRLKKGVRRVLHDGDIISLVNPDLRLPGLPAVVERDFEMASFFVHILLPSIEEVKSTNLIASGLSSGEMNGGLRDVRSDTVTHMLGQERNIFDYYDQKELLGSGANGQVYRCIHKVDGHECAVKATNMRQGMTPTGAIDTSGVERILMEAHMIRNLKHENIIRLEDVFSDRNTLFLVMELVRGGDLFDRIVKLGRYSEGDAKVVMKQVLSAMKFMHDKNIAHRDMKPENILLLRPDSDIDVKLTDFGLAKSVDAKGGLKTYCGTAHYFAPEVLDKQSSENTNKTYGFEADMWSIGVIVFVLLCGDYPWSADHGIMCQEISAGRVNFQKSESVWRTLSVEAKDFTSRLIVLDPASRMTAAQALEHPWFDSLIESQPTNMSSPKVTTRQKGKKRKLEENATILDDISVLDSEQTNVDTPNQRSTRSRMNTGNGQAPMEISLTTTRSRLPRKAKQTSNCGVVRRGKK